MYDVKKCYDLLQYNIIMCINKFRWFYGDFEALFREIGTKYIIQRIAYVCYKYIHCIYVKSFKIDYNDQ